jgi:ParB family chromosome partitioning protein
MDFARELKRLRDEGWEYSAIAKVACKTEKYIREYIRLVEQGEERLIHGVETGVFPIKFAIQVATTDDSQIQNILMDAFDDGVVTTNNFGQARRIITARSKRTRKSSSEKEYSVGQLKHDIAETTRVKTSYVREAKSKESRFMTLLSGINTLFQDATLVALLRGHNLDKRPELAGDFQFEPLSSGDHTE